jgi:hypothetical protein
VRIGKVTEKGMAVAGKMDCRGDTLIMISLSWVFILWEGVLVLDAS